MRMRWIWLTTLIVMVGIGSVGISPATAKTTKPVSLDGKVNVDGKKNISTKTSASITIGADDFSFSPTFVKVAPGQQVTIELENEGAAPHTFTSTRLDVDEQVSPGESTTFTITAPSDRKVFQFHCDFHESMGMQGAFYTKRGTAAKATATTKAETTGGYGY